MSEPDLPKELRDALATEAARDDLSAAAVERMARRLDFALALPAPAAPAPAPAPAPDPVASAARIAKGTALAKAAAIFGAGALVGGGVVATVRETPRPVAPIAPIATVAAVATVSAPPPVVPSAAPIASAHEEAPAPRPSAAVRPAPSAPDPFGPSVEEQALVDAARSALARGEPDHARRALERHARSYPKGSFAEEREALMVRTLEALGRTADARARLAAFRTAYPNSVLTPRLAEP